ncbi:MAG: Hsp20/alpha crystallin family protein [Desulfovibrio sp.]|nr:Hsp20/alpha crystallin family protein [Desulfovibrio sp.]
MRTDFLVPTSPFTNDNFFGQGGLIDRMFDTSLPWKILKTLSTTENQGQDIAFLPSLDVKSDEKEYTIHVEIPGVSKDDVKLEIHDGVLMLSGEKKEEVTDKTNHVLERRFGSFERQLSVPDDADIEHITATHTNGVLTITIPRLAPKANAKAITITSTEA